jgi:hypothetical protein
MKDDNKFMATLPKKSPFDKILGFYLIDGDQT